MTTLLRDFSVFHSTYYIHILTDFDIKFSESYNHEDATTILKFTKITLFISWIGFVIYLKLVTDIITTLTYVLMDSFCPCLFVVLNILKIAYPF